MDSESTGAIGREPSDELDVSLSETLTYIAFGDALSHDELRQQVEGHDVLTLQNASDEIDKISQVPQEHRTEEYEADLQKAKLLAASAIRGTEKGTGHFVDRAAGLTRLDDAWQQVRREVKKGAMMVRGRYSPKCALAENLEDHQTLTGDDMTTYCQFDVSTGGIQQQPDGSPSVIWKDHPLSFERMLGLLGHGEPNHAKGFLEVVVDRDDLMRLTARNAPTGHEHAGPDAHADQPFSEEELDQWIHEVGTTRTPPTRNGDEAHKLYKMHARYNGIKQREFREKWRENFPRGKGRPRNQG